MQDQIYIQVRFWMTDEETGITYSDALSFTENEYTKLSDSKLNKLKQDRFDSWKQTLNQAQNAPQADPIEQIASVDAQLEQLTKQRETMISDILTNTDDTSIKTPDDVNELVEQKKAEQLDSEVK